MSDDVVTCDRPGCDREPVDEVTRRDGEGVLWIYNVCPDDAAWAEGELLELTP